MDFRSWILSLFLCTLATLAHADEMDRLATQIYQFPNQAANKIGELEQHQDKLSSSEQLRLQLLKCQLMIQLGDNSAAIDIAQQGQLRAKQAKLDIVAPYFEVCAAEAYQDMDELKQSLPLLDSTALYAKKNSDYQLLFSVLRLRAESENELSNFAAAIEDLRLAMDIYPDIQHQSEAWLNPPLAYVYADMASVLQATGDYSQADYYLNLAQAEPSSNGKIRHVLYLMQSRVALDQGKVEQSNSLLNKAIETLHLVQSDVEKAPSYAQISAIYLMLNELSEASKYSNLALNLYEKLGISTGTIGISRLAARIKMRQGDLEGALNETDNSLSLSIALTQPFDTAASQQLRAEILYKQGKLESAYQALQSAIVALQQAQDKLNSTQFMQYKAKLSLQEQQQSQAQQQIKAATNNSEQKLKRAYTMIYALLLVLVAVIFWIISRYKNWYPKVSKPTADDSEQWVEAMIETAKAAGYPLSLLIVNINHIKQVDLPDVIEQATHRLREQDKIIRHSVDELLVLLPHTSAEGATRVVRQLEPVLHMFSMQPASIGMAEMKQPDNLQSLIKRANVNQLSRTRERGVPQTSLR
ncbi:hypothetical protein HR45_16830 [Shewanella mangrovi]|uniref:GGDEF domain-containing protein n=1 Tax=Shewanella mangrovi TaxID=1515746 RepID=A0A094LMJ7_9GAMM|nr:hypothetical protein [Shewanella mangrovi]KFZ36323.1 hypothetical protein HR45_16830 [Shewanella mangrovi]